MEIKIESSWKKVLSNEFESTYFHNIVSFIKKEIESGKTILPPGHLLFNAFEKTPFNKVKIVILGQDPYHNIGEAMGLSFSVPKEVKVPPSLRNIYKELSTDIDFHIPTHGDLSLWADQGVFLLNAMLSVECNKASSHQNIGWQLFTDAVIKKLSNDCSNIVFMLWGNFAKKKADLVDSSKHLVLTAAHPSPLAGGAFFGNKHFSKANEYLINNNLTPINWNLQ
jgi:uracil-DNA glycosylase